MEIVVGRSNVHLHKMLDLGHEVYNLGTSKILKIIVCNIQSDATRTMASSPMQQIVNFALEIRHCFPSFHQI
jgi:hypothetical protein